MDKAIDLALVGASGVVGNKIISSIREKYGDGVLDPKTGTFIPNKS